MYEGASTASSCISKRLVTTKTRKTSEVSSNNFKENDHVVVVSFGKRENNVEREDRPYIIVKGCVVNPGSNEHDPNLKIGFLEADGKPIFFQGGSKHYKLFTGTNGMTEATAWCQTLSLENKRKVMIFPDQHSSNKSFTRVVKTTKTNVPSWNVPDELKVRRSENVTIVPASMKDDNAASPIQYTDKTISLDPLLQHLGCKLLQLDTAEVGRLQTSAKTVSKDTTWVRSSGAPFRHTFSRLAGTSYPSADDWALYHRYTWGGSQYGCVEKQSCCHPIPPAVDRVAAYLSRLFDQEFGGMCLNAGQILYYQAATGIGAHDDGSAQSSTAKNSQCGHTGVVSITTEGTGTMQFSHRSGSKNSSRHNVCNVELGPGSVFLMSAVCDRLLLHQMIKVDAVRTAIILRVLNQPRWYKTCAPFNIFDGTCRV